jgi:hypothetical protein
VNANTRTPRRRWFLGLPAAALSLIHWRPLKKWKKDLRDEFFREQFACSTAGNDVAGYKTFNPIENENLSRIFELEKLRAENRRLRDELGNVAPHVVRTLARLDDLRKEGRWPVR